LRRFLGGVDLGDLAHQLGDRVRDVRAQPRVPSAETGPVLQRPPSRPVATAIGTKTFAAREPLGSQGAATGALEPSTRRTASQQPGGLEKEAVATRSVSTGARTDARRRRQRWLGLGALAAAAIAIGSFFVGRGLASPPAAEPPAAVRPRDVVLPMRAAVDTPVPGSPSSAAAPAAPSASAPAAASVHAELALLGDGARVRVDGVLRGSCPTRVSVVPGAHAIEFSFPATGESEVETLTVLAGQKATLRADFTGARPTIRIER
jgi:hypothetical protein